MSSENQEELRATLTDQMQLLQSTVDSFDEAAAANLGVGRTDLRCLEILVGQDTATPGMLIPALGLTTGGVTAMLTRLERLGYLERSPDPDDGRKVIVRITDEARRRAWDLYGPIAAEGADMISGYDSAELELLSNFLRSARELYERQLAQVRDRRIL